MIVAVRFAVCWPDVALPACPRFGTVTVSEGTAAWGWEPVPPDLPIPSIAVEPGEPVPGWEIDHIVVVTPNLEDTVTRLAAAGSEVRRRGEARGRRAVFLRAGPVIEVVETDAPGPQLWGLALATAEPLGAVAARWAAAGWDTTAVKAAVQPGRRLFTVRGANLAVFDR